jgi:hypothetical protein
MCFLAGQIDLPERSQTLRYSRTVFVSLAGKHLLCPAGHFHGKHEDRQGNECQHADYQ